MPGRHQVFAARLLECCEDHGSRVESGERCRSTGGRVPPPHEPPQKWTIAARSHGGRTRRRKRKTHLVLLFYIILLLGGSDGSSSSSRAGLAAAIRCRRRRGNASGMVSQLSKGSTSRWPSTNAVQGQGATCSKKALG